MQQFPDQRRLKHLAFQEAEKPYSMMDEIIK
jgi:hypothetical protein